MFRRLPRRMAGWSALVLIFFLSGNALAQYSGKVIGQIRVVKGDFPPHPIMVELQLRGAAINSTYADAEGRFGFYELDSILTT